MGSMLNIASRMEGPEQKTIIGKSEITVSAKGITNGKSVYLNDGADFGPDTSGTKSTGVFEACNYAIQNNLSVIDCSSGNFYFSAGFTGTINADLEIKGQGLRSTAFIMNSPSATGQTGLMQFTTNQQGFGISIKIHDLNLNGSSANYQKWFQIYHGGSSSSTTHSEFYNIALGSGSAGIVYENGGNNTGCAIIHDCIFSENIDGDVTDFQNMINVEVHSNIVYAQANPSFVLYPASSTAPKASIDVHDNIFIGNGTYVNSLVSLWAGNTSTFYGSVKIHDNILYSPSTSDYLYEIDSPNTTNTMSIDSLEVYENTLLGSTSYFVNKQSIAVTIAKQSSTHNIGYNPQGFAITTPALPAAVGSADAVTNTFPFVVRIFQAGESGTHVVDNAGNDVLLPADPAEVTLDPGDKIYYATTVATSWKWYGV